MLVLSRRPQQKVLFPNLGVSVEILSVQGQLVKVGVEAPRDVPIWRDEIAPTAGVQEKSPEHRLRNRLNQAGITLHLARRQLQAGQQVAADTTLLQALSALEALDREWLAPPAAAVAPRPSREVHALLVEDNCNESELLATFLRLHGIAVETTSDGLGALEYLAAHELPDVVLLDMLMPRCDGPHTIAAIRRDPRLFGLKVFAVSGTSQEQCGIPIGPEGVDRWFTKPLNPARLAQEVTELAPA
jgi:carbon storage regulator CsrA